MHALGALVPGAAAVPADARFHPKEGNNSAETKQTDPHPTESKGKDAGSSSGEDSNQIQLEMTLATTHPCSTGPGTGAGGSKSPSTTPKTGGSKPPAPLVQTSTIIAVVSAAAAGLFLLLLAFLCYRRKGPAPRQSRESEPATTVYALMGEGKQLDVLPQKPDPSAEGHTYAELDGQALQAKQGGAAPAPEPPLYSTITMSQGPNGQSPQGAAEPPTDPDSVNPGGVTGETGQEASATTE